MSSFKPKGRRAIPDELLALGKHLVYAEGTKTEPYYVQNIKNCIASRYNCEPNNIDIVLANGKKSYHTVSLVKYAKKDVEKRIQSGERINHVLMGF